MDQQRHNVALDQTEYGNGLDPVDINSQCACQKEDTLTTKEQPGSEAWRVVSTGPSKVHVLMLPLTWLS